MVWVVNEGSEEGYGEDLGYGAWEPGFSLFPSGDGHVGFDEEATVDALCDTISSVYEEVAR